jgi:ATP phosphoribosyltransferase regulatory subunit
MIILTVECLKAAGLSDFQVELGHAGFFSGLIKEAAFDEDTVIELKSLIENKNYFGIEELLSDSRYQMSLRRYS